MSIINGVRFRPEDVPKGRPAESEPEPAAAPSPQQKKEPEPAAPNRKRR